MAYVFHSADAQDDAVMAALHGREKEHANYQQNIDAFNAMLTTAEMTGLPPVYPSNLAQYQSPDIWSGVKLASLVIAGTISPSDFTLLSQLRARDQINNLLMNHQVQQAITARTYAALTIQVGDPVRYAAAVARHKAKMNAGGAG